jgi:hypothetical protein
MITIANKRNTKEGFYIGRPSPLGNPFIIGRDGTREEVIEKYREWLDLQLIDWSNKTELVRHSMQSLIWEYTQHKKLTLLCWCAPLPCHGDVIKAKIESVISFDEDLV